MSDETDIAQGHKARAELERTEAAFLSVEADTVKALKSPHTPEEATRLICTLQLLDDIQKRLMREVAFGQAAQFRRDQG